MVSIGGDRVLEVLLPRCSILGVINVLFHSTGFIARQISTLILFGSCLSLYVLSLILFVELAITDGTDTDILYYLSPIVSQALAVLFTASYLAWHAQTDESVLPKWATSLHLVVKPKHDARVEMSNLTRIPVFWMQLHYVLQDSGMHDADFLMCHGTLIDIKAKDHSSDHAAKVLYLDDAPDRSEDDSFKNHDFPPPSLLTRIPMEETLERMKMQIGTHAAAWMAARRTPVSKRDKGKDDFALSGMAETMMDFVG